MEGKRLQMASTIVDNKWCMFLQVTETFYREVAKKDRSKVAIYNALVQYGIVQVHCEAINNNNNKRMHLLCNVHTRACFPWQAVRAIGNSGNGNRKWKMETELQKTETIKT